MAEKIGKIETFIYLKSPNEPDVLVIWIVIKILIYLIRKNKN